MELKLLVFGIFCSVGAFMVKSGRPPLRIHSGGGWEDVDGRRLDAAYRLENGSIVYIREENQ